MRAKPRFEQSVFINCPFDPAYEDLLHAIVLTTVSLGFVPRCALESGDSDYRFPHILDLLATSKYSIHDLSRFTGEGPANLSRMNMPLELGVAIGLKQSQSRRKRRWAVMVPELPANPGSNPNAHEYQRYISDLAGKDPLRHEQTPESVIREVYSWLKTLDEVVNPQPNAPDIVTAFPSFQRKIADRKNNALGKSIWADVLTAALEAAPKVNG
ncbi:MAG: hypothetical protein JOZ83_07065 [Silvibacterium sp.]|nr:hypothetical protein [Silvibacterium sp.]